jgi:YVTN family beta-propeller protein
VYVTEFFCTRECFPPGGGSSVAVFDETTLAAIDNIPNGNSDWNVAITPDGSQLWALTTNASTETTFYQVIAAANNATLATILAPGGGSSSITFTPDSKQAYIVESANIVEPLSAVDTSTFVVTTIPVEGGAVAVTPDGNYIYATNYADNNVSVIATATNAVVANIPVGKQPFAIGIMPDLPFSFFSSKLVISGQSNPYFELLSNVTLGNGAAFLDPPAQPVTVQAGTFGATIPPGSFKESQPGGWDFDGPINGVSIHAKIWLTGTKQYLALVKAQTALTGATNPVPVGLTLGPNSGTARVTAAIYN